MFRVPATNTENDYDDCHVCNPIHLVVAFVFLVAWIEFVFVEFSATVERTQDFDPFSDDGTIQSDEVREKWSYYQATEGH
jgi:thiosulfate reductase cytochrome b subunit